MPGAPLSTPFLLPLLIAARAVRCLHLIAMQLELLLAAAKCNDMTRFYIK